MPVWIAGLLKYVPFVGGLLEKWTGGSARAAELRAEKELEEARAFKRGRISPKYLSLYILVLVFLFFAIGTFMAVFFPAVMPDADLGRFRELIDAGQDMSGKM